MPAAHALRAIPSVEKVLQALGPGALPRPLLVSLVREELASLRAGKGKIPPLEQVLERVRARAEAMSLARIRPVINATGILLHTNLGRAPLPGPVLDALREAGGQYNNLEFDLGSGERGGRAGYLERLLALLCQAEAATVVNNCAAALVLILRNLASGPRREVVISRGELVQIGGGFRIPEILEASGAALREVGTTNRTSLADYEQALRPSTALILKVHRSNFFMGGFVESPSTSDLAALARRRKIPLVEDLGSGAVAATEKVAAIEHETTPAEVLKQGVDLVCFSGDKLFGGPQAGLIAGRERRVAALKRDPFFRALRCDKLILAGLQRMAELYLEDRREEIPILRMLGAPEGSLRERAEFLAQRLQGLPVEIRIGAGRTEMGGGTLPRSTLPSVALEIRSADLRPQELAARLRRGTIPVVGYVAGGAMKLDLRTVFPHQDLLLAEAVRSAVAGPPEGSS